MKKIESITPSATELRTKSQDKIQIKIENEPLVTMTNFSTYSNDESYESKNDSELVLNNLGGGNIWIDNRDVAFRIMWSKENNYYLLEVDELNKLYKIARK